MSAQTPVVETLDREDDFAALADQWDGLVEAMPRPSPFLLHGWLRAWWRHERGGARPEVHVVRRGDRLVGALPLVLSTRAGVRRTEFLGGMHSALGDVLLAADADAEVGRRLVARALESPTDVLDLFGLPHESRLAAVSDLRLRLVERVEAPVLDMPEGWEAAYRAKTVSKKRNQHKRRRRQLSELGNLEVQVARTWEELEPALEDAFRLHRLRWEGRPDASDFGTAQGRRFHRAAIEALSARGVPRLVMLRLDGRAIAFHYYLALAGAMYVHRLAFDPELSRFSPGLVNTLDALQAASDEGLTRVEFLGADERYKVELSDRMEPLFQGLVAVTPVRGRAAVSVRLGAIRARRRLKRSELVRRAWFEGLAPARRALQAARRRD